MAAAVALAVVMVVVAAATAAAAVVAAAVADEIATTTVTKLVPSLRRFRARRKKFRAGNPCGFPAFSHIHFL
jgi:hypothetical protein